MRQILLVLAVAAAPAAPQDVIRTTTRLVEIDVAARDAHGAVANLTKDDFAVYDNGKRQPIGVFERVALSPAAPVAGDTVTNQRPEGADRSPAIVVLLDSLNTDRAEQTRSQSDVLKFLRTVAPPQRVAVYRLGWTLQVEQDFTDDASRLGAAVERGAEPGSNAGPNAALARLVDAVRLTFVSSNPPEKPEPQVRETCIRLIALAKYLGRIPGRKHVLWMTHAFPLRSGNLLFADEVSQVNHAFTDAQVAVDAVDTHGLEVGQAQMFQAPLPSGSRRSTPGMAPATGLPPGPMTVAPGIAPPGPDTMQYVAHFTGGQAFFDRNDIAVAMQSAVKTAEAGYILAFYANAEALDSKRHTLKVTVARGGVDLAYRRGYTATPDDPAAKIPEKGQIAQALWSPLDEEGITIMAKTEKVDQPERGLVRITVAIPGRDVAVQHTEKGWTGELALLFDERAADGRDLGRITETVNLQYDEEHLRRLNEDGVTYPRLVRPSGGAAQVRVVVYDRNSGRLGSLTVPLK
jgi:VWFA-related protein